MSDDSHDDREEMPTTLRRQGALKLSALVRAADEEALARFRKQHLRGGEVELETLVAARRALEHLVRLLEDPEHEGWSQVPEWVATLASDEVSDEPSEDEEEESDAASDEEPTTDTVPRPPELFERLPPEGALAAHRDAPSPWTSWSGAAKPERSAPRSAPPPAMPSAPPPPMPSAPPPPMRSASPAVPSAPPLPSTPPPAMPPPPGASSIRPAASSTTAPAAGATRAPAVAAAPSDGGPLRPLPPAADTLADVTAPPVTGRDPALPFKRPDEGQTQHLVHTSLAHGLALSLREYAALCAEAEEAPERRHLVHERYHVGEGETRKLLHAAYEIRFGEDPSLRASWQRHYEQFRATLRGSR